MKPGLGGGGFTQLLSAALVKISSRSGVPRLELHRPKLTTGSQHMNIFAKELHVIDRSRYLHIENILYGA
jgi:hypothetical protein